MDDLKFKYNVHVTIIIIDNNEALSYFHCSPCIHVHVHTSTYMYIIIIEDTPNSLTSLFLMSKESEIHGFRLSIRSLMFSK